jgi:hypothetical protein
MNLLKDNGYENLFENKPTIQKFTIYHIESGFSRFNINQEELIRLWKNYFNIEPSTLEVEKGLDYLKKISNPLIIKFSKKLPSLNTSKNEILILEEKKNLTQEYWEGFSKYYVNSNIAYKDLRKKDFLIDKNLIFADLIDYIFLVNSDDIAKERKKKIYILFFLYLTSKNVCLIPASFIFSKYKIFEQTSRQEVLSFFQKNHFLFKESVYTYLIDNELKVKSNAKKNFYLRFSFLIKNQKNLIKDLSDNEMEVILNNLKETGKSKKMVLDYENFIRKILFWNGADNLSQTRRETRNQEISPIEILGNYQSTFKNKVLINSFIRYFNQKRNTAKSIKYTYHVIDLLDYLSMTFENITVKDLVLFFKVYVKKDKLTSNFIEYMENIQLAITVQQELQMIVFVSLGNEESLNTIFLKQNIISLYKMPKTRNVARRAFKKEILEAMKYICIFDPPADDYYVKTTFNNKFDSWNFFDRVEPQLPVMLFLHLCMPWRKEHIISLDRENFLIKDEFSNIIAIQLSTDKNQKKDFYIEREIFEYALDHNFLINNKIDIFKLLNDTVEHSKKSFPNLQSLERKSNEVWGKITPLLCSNDAKGFISNGIYDGYYYKVLVKALIYLGYSNQEIFYYIELSATGLKKYNNENINLLEETYKLTSSEFNRNFNSQFYSPHSLRKSNITHFLLDGKTLEFIIKLSGHEAISTVLKAYIDYSFLKKMKLSENVLNKIEECFSLDSSTREYSKKIIEIFKKYHTIEINEVKEKLEEYNLSGSILTVTSDLKSIKKQQEEKKDILSPIFWENLSVGICTGALNCPININNRCSLCNYFYTGPKYFAELNSKIMQLSTKLVKYFNVIQKYTVEENININEALIYEEETKLDLAELQGYIAIVSGLNDNIKKIISEESSKDIVKYVKGFKDINFINIEHNSFYTAQLEIYTTSKKNMSLNLDIEYAISELYKKILELIIMGKIDNRKYLETLSSPNKTIDLFIASNKIDNKKYLFE